MSRFTFPHKMEVRETHGISAAQADRLLGAWQKAYPDAERELRLRYAEVKEVGKRILDNAPPPRREFSTTAVRIYTCTRTIAILRRLAMENGLTALFFAVPDSVAQGRR